ncbi:MAG: 4-hydroxy-tetrahydrodipicolinate synthase [Chlamydiales bacterium]|nr:4-hydroxy-tetrahydrodipicolinate synthase [Chlamydiales bacterium]MCH9620223.1 4-hydroxy-tetrahydrodipicolinate synthase [Chlamydiales bacterium]MCH9623062.1 4-hydroxy-tetrahydrodipicolinate synthase [Chlamydiales bacterium]
MTIIYTALITPFKEDKLDKEGLVQLISDQKEAGIDGILALGTTAETPTLSGMEKKEIIKLAVKHSDHLKVSCGCGASSTTVTLDNIKQAADLGCDNALVVSPPYNCPMPQGLLTHFTTLADASPIPLILYNHPYRSSVNLTVDIQLELAKHPNIIGVKEGSGKIEQMTDLLTQCPSSYLAFAGDDLQTLPFLSLGGHGLFSVAANLIPRLVRELVDRRSETLLKQLWPLYRALFCETNPIPIKAALSLCGKPAGLPRLPLTPLSKEGQTILTPPLKKVCALQS